MQQISPGVIADQLAAQVESVVRDLLPQGKKLGHEWCVGSTGGEPGESTKVHLTGERAGLWRDFAEGGPGGDLLDLISAVRGVDLKGALDYACRFLGIERPEFKSAKPRTYVRPERPENMRSVQKVEPVMAWLLARGLTDRTIEAYKVAARRKEIIFPFLRDGELIHVKYRDISDKKKMYTSADSEKCLFGWQVIDPKARTVVITEGEIDAMTMYQYGYPAMSVPYGAGKGGKQDWIDSEFENMERFDTIYVCMDDDAEGKLAAIDIVDRLGRHRCKVVELPHKDANECLTQGVEKDTIDRAIKAARTLDPSELRNSREYRDAIVRRFHGDPSQRRGFLLPWENMVNRFSFEWGATTIIAGYNGHGKSTIIGQIVADAIQQDVKACVGSFEFKPDKWISALVRQVTCEIQPSIPQIDKAVDWLAGGLWAFDVTGRGMGTAKIDRVLEVFAYARARYGCRLFIIDNFAKLGIDEDDYNGQKKAMVLTTEFAVEHDVHLIIAAHMRKSESDSMRGGKLGVRGSSTITDLPDNVWEISRSRKREDDMQRLHGEIKRCEDTTDRAALQEELDALKEKPDARFACEKYRTGDEEPVIALRFDKESHQFMQMDAKGPRRYV